MSIAEMKQAVRDRINMMSPEELKQLVEGFIENLFEEPKNGAEEKVDINEYIRANYRRVIEEDHDLLQRLAQ